MHPASGGRELDTFKHNFTCICTRVIERTGCPDDVVEGVLQLDALVLTFTRSPVCALPNDIRAVDINTAAVFSCHKAGARDLVVEYRRRAAETVTMSALLRFHAADREHVLASLRGLRNLDGSARGSEAAAPLRSGCQIT
jgi:hypothetical protein